MHSRRLVTFASASVPSRGIRTKKCYVPFRPTGLVVPTTRAKYFEGLKYLGRQFPTFLDRDIPQDRFPIKMVARQTTQYGMNNSAFLGDRKVVLTGKLENLDLTEDEKLCFMEIMGNRISSGGGIEGKYIIACDSFLRKTENWAHCLRTLKKALKKAKEMAAMFPKGCSDPVDEAERRRVAEENQKLRPRIRLKYLWRNGVQEEIGEEGCKAHMFDTSRGVTPSKFEKSEMGKHMIMRTKRKRKAMRFREKELEKMRNILAKKEKEFEEKRRAGKEKYEEENVADAL